MNLERVRLFIDVARRRNLAAVARERGVDPSQVSRAIAALEGELRVRLFQRSTRRLSLTAAGERWLDEAPALLDSFDRLREAVRADGSGSGGLVRLTASVAFCDLVLTPLLPEFAARHPGVVLEILATDANLDLVEERIDVAVRLSPARRTDVAGERLKPTRYQVVASPEYIARAGAPSAPEKLSERTCLVFTFADFRTRWKFRDGQGAVRDVPVSASFAFSSALPLRSAALRGLGPALLADWMVEGDLSRGTLVDLFPDYGVTATTFDTAAWLLYPSRDWLPGRVRATIAFLKQRLGAPA